jgi:hypothetical protein
MTLQPSDLTARVLGHECKTMEFWAHALEKPLEQRIGIAPAQLIDLIQLDNMRQAVPQTPRAPLLTPGLLAETKAALAELPGPIKRLLTRKFAGVYFVANFGGTGATDQILDAASRPVAGFVVLDPVILETMTANAWVTWRENTPFISAPDFELTVQLEERAQDRRIQAIQYILLHELGHVLAIDAAVHPSWAIAPHAISADQHFPFFSQSWSVSTTGDRYVSHFDASFPQRRDLVYYREARLPAADLTAVYDWLEHTNFATLYAATSPFEDFAEAFATYVHTVLMNKPFEARIYQRRQLVKTFRPDWSHERWRVKRRTLEHILGAT